MKHQSLLYVGHGGQPSHDERSVVPTTESFAGGAAGTAGLQWLWGMVELRLSQAEPDTAA
jgi:hypothetical protein